MKIINYNGTESKLELIKTLPEEVGGQVYVMCRVRGEVSWKDNLIKLPEAVWMSLPNAK